MEANINGINIKGTPKEMLEYQKLLNKNGRDNDENEYVNNIIQTTENISKNVTLSEIIKTINKLPRIADQNKFTKDKGGAKMIAHINGDIVQGAPEEIKRYKELVEDKKNGYKIGYDKGLGDKNSYSILQEKELVLSEKDAKKLLELVDIVKKCGLVDYFF